MMVFSGLSRCDLVSVCPVSSCDTLKVLPFGKSRRQKFVVGDGSGYLTCFQCKRGETSVVYKSKVKSGIGCVTLCDDKIFVADGRCVRGFNRKGKEFVEVRTNLSETIQHVFVRDKHIWVAGELTYASYLDGKEVEYLKCWNQITCMLVLSDGSGVLLGGRDGEIRLVRGGENISSKSMGGGGITALQELNSPSTIAYGTERGVVGVTSLDNSTTTTNNNHNNHKWASTSMGHACNCIVGFDLEKTDSPQVICGYDDGMVRIFTLDHGMLRFEKGVGESVRSIQVGVVNIPGYDEIVLCTYSGNIISLTTEALDQMEEGDKKGRSKAKVDNEGKIKQLQEELKKIDQQLAKKSNNKKHQSIHEIDFQHLQVNQRFYLDPDQGIYMLSLEMAIPIDLVLLQSTTTLHLVEDDNNKNVVITCNEQKTQAVYRSTSEDPPVKRMEIRLNTVEGEYGELKATIVCKKIAKQVVLDIKPLSLHYRVEQQLQQSQQQVCSTMQLSGSFSMNQIHEWLKTCLPDISANPSSDEEAASISFENALVKTVLRVDYKAGEALISSDSISALAILREVITAEANKRKVTINIKYDINAHSVPSFLKRVDKLLRQHVKHAQSAQLFDALKEITNDADNDVSFLPKEYQNILKKKGNKNNKATTTALQTIYGIIYDLYVDQKKFQGKDARNPTVHGNLIQLLENYDGDHDFQALLDFFS